MRAVSVFVLGASLAFLGLWRGACVLAGPDVDTDAYAHHMVARAILGRPTDLSLHWVWLPLFHYLQVPLVALGGTMQEVRWANGVLAAILPVALFEYVRRTTRPSAMPPEIVALVAALFAAACPIAMQTATSAQPEPLFALLVLVVAITYQEGRYGTASAALGAAVLLRYEAWATLATVAALALIEPAIRRRRGLPPEPFGGRAWITVAIPSAMILAWAALRRPVDGAWFAFVSQTHEFAAGAAPRAPQGISGAARDWLYYPYVVAYRVLGVVLALVPFGVARTLRQQGARFVLCQLACLGFVSLSWVQRSSLGLDRHFVAVVALYATFAAQGIAACADGSAWLLERTPLRRAGGQVGRLFGVALSLASLGVLCVSLRVWMGFWRAAIARGWPEREALAATLRSLPPGPTIFCDDASFEILSGLDRRRFDRHMMDDPSSWELVRRAALADGEAYVATWARKLRGTASPGTVVFRARPPGTGEDSEMIVIRVSADNA